MKDNLPRKWIWFRGLIRWKVHWGDFFDQFHTQFPNDEVQMIDFPGFGDFHKKVSPWEVSGLLDHVDQQVKGEGPFHVLGFSLGAMVATHWSARHPGKVKMQFLINTSDNRSPFYRRMQPELWPMIATRLIYPTANRVEWGVLKIVSNSPEIRKRWGPHFEKAYEKTPITRHGFLAQIRTATHVRFPDSPPVPSVILCSKGDRLAHYSCSEKISKLWACPLEIHPSAGHDLTLDNGPWVLDQMHKYLDKSSEKSAISSL
jgi:pimeloyl-[acyl-carrier protein] methyl ester esterase